MTNFHLPPPQFDTLRSQHLTFEIKIPIHFYPVIYVLSWHFSYLLKEKATESVRFICCHQPDVFRHLSSSLHYLCTPWKTLHLFHSDEVLQYEWIAWYLQKRNQKQTNLSLLDWMRWLIPENCLFSVESLVRTIPSLRKRWPGREVYQQSQWTIPSRLIQCSRSEVDGCVQARSPLDWKVQNCQIKARLECLLLGVEIFLKKKNRWVIFKGYAQDNVYLMIFIIIWSALKLQVGNGILQGEQYYLKNYNTNKYFLNRFVFPYRYFPVTPNSIEYISWLHEIPNGHKQVTKSRTNESATSDTNIY